MNFVEISGAGRGETPSLSEQIALAEDALARAEDDLIRADYTDDTRKSTAEKEDARRRIKTWSDRLAELRAEAANERAHVEAAVASLGDRIAANGR